MTGVPPAIGDRFAAALAAHRGGRFAAAEAGYRDCLAADPGHAEAAHRLGQLLLQTGRVGAARPWLEAAAATTPARDDRQADAGAAAAADGAIAAARHHFETALRLRPDHAQHHYNLARLAEQTGAPDAALAGYRRAVALRPDFTEARLNAALITAATPAGAGDAAVHAEIADCQRRLGRHVAAAEALRVGLGLAPGDPALTAALARAVFRLGRADDAVPLFRRALARWPDDAAVHSELIFALYFAAGATAAAIEAEQRAWGDRHAPAAAPAGRHAVPAAVRTTTPRPKDMRTGILRLGVVGCDFKDHSNAWMFGPLFDPTGDPAVAIVIYADVADPDAVTERYRRGPAAWHDVRGLDDAALAARVRDDGIDVLIDLIGHTTRNRLGAFAHRPAPVQVSWVNPTGVGAVDWLLTDAVLRPPAGDDPTVDRERPWRLPLGAMPFVPPADAPDPAAPGSVFSGLPAPGLPAPGLPAPGLPAWPATAGGPVFGCFNNLIKLSAPLLDAWARILAALPAAVLLLKYPGLDDPGMQADLGRRVAAHGIAPDRLRLLGRTGRADHLAAYCGVDVALDTFPGNGGVTTWEALWMGVPLVALRGDRPNGRASAAILASVGLTGWVAPSVADYVALAVALGRQPRGDRAALRARLAAAPIQQPGAYARSVQDACRAMLAGAPPP